MGHIPIGVYSIYAFFFLGSLVPSKTTKVKAAWQVGKTKVCSDARKQYASVEDNRKETVDTKSMGTSFIILCPYYQWRAKLMFILPNQGWHLPHDFFFFVKKIFLLICDSNLVLGLCPVRRFGV